MRALVLVVPVVALTSFAAAQAPSTTFDVSSIRRNTSGLIAGPGARSVGVRPGGRFVLEDGAIMVLIRSAYPDATEVIGAPAWVSSEHYDVQAKAEGNPTPEQMLPLLRALLAQRFKLVARTETRVQPTYALVVARPDGRLGPGLRPYPGDCAASAAATRSGTAPPALPPPSNGGLPCGYRMGGSSGMTSVVSGGVTMNMLADMLGSPAGRVVIDKTGLSGLYEFTLEYAFRPDPDRPSVFTALQEQLGLKLEPAQAPLPVLVIDSIERPTPD